MKKRILSVLSSIIIVLVISTIAFAADTWGHYFPVTIIDTSGTARTNLPVLLGFAGQNMVDAGYMASDGMDTRMRQGSTDIPYGLSTTQVPVYVDSLSANGQKTYNFYTDYSPVQTTLDIMVGNGGYITVSDAAALELGNNFEIEQDGYVDTSSGSNKNLVYKQDAFTTYISAASEITSSIHNGVLGDSYTTGEDQGVESYGVIWLAQTFTPSSTFTAERVQLKLYRTGSPGTMIVSIKATSADLPSGADIVSGTYDGNTLSNSSPGSYVEIDFTSSTSLTGSTKYAIVISAASGDASNKVHWRTDDTSPTYAGGAKCFSNDSGSSWTEDATIDFMFRVYGDVEATATGVSSGEHKVKTTADATNLKIYIDDVEEDSTALSGASVTDNANDLILNQNSVIPYMDFYKHTVGGTLIAHYEPNQMLTGTTLPDREGAAQNGTITWGSNADITIVYGSMVSSDDTSLAIGQTGLGFTVPSADMPAQWFASGSNLANLPLYPMFNDISTQTGMPTQTIYMWFILAVGVALAIWTYASTKSILLGVLTMTVMMIVGSAMTVIPAWMFFVYILMGGGMMYLTRQI